MHQRRNTVKWGGSMDENDDAIHGTTAINNGDGFKAPSPIVSKPIRLSNGTLAGSGSKEKLHNVPDAPWGENSIGGSSAGGAGGTRNGLNTAVVFGRPPVRRKRVRKVNVNNTAKSMFSTMRRTLFGESYRRKIGEVRGARRKTRLVNENSFAILIVLLVVSGLAALNIFAIVDKQNASSTSRTVPTTITSTHATEFTTAGGMATSTRAAINNPWWNLVIANSQFLDHILRNKKSTRQVLSTDRNDLKPIILKSSSSSSATATIHYPGELSDEDAEEGEYMDFADLNIRMFEDHGQQRQIHHDFWLDEGEARSLDRSRDDDVEPYYAFDDDYIRNPYYKFTDDTIQDERRCRRTNWHRLNLRNCNHFHELDLPRIGPEFVGDGAYREVFVVDVETMNSVETVIFKEIRWDNDMQYDAFEDVRVDALITERLTSDRRIVDIYGYCGLSMLTEFFPYGDVENTFVGDKHRYEHYNPDDKYDVRPQNNLTAYEKLFLALEMAEPIMSLHNFKDGVIVHDDIQLVQYLFTKEDTLKLNDFNRAEVMFWDEENQLYCRYKNGVGPADWRAPEEYFDAPLNEKIDIWSLGNNIYSLLTGLYPFYDVPDHRKIRNYIKHEQTAWIDPRYRKRSFEESVLVRVIELCWIFEPDERASIAEIVQILRDGFAESEKRHDQEHERDRLQQIAAIDYVNNIKKRNKKRKKDNSDNRGNGNNKNNKDNKKKNKNNLKKKGMAAPNNYDGNASGTGSGNSGSIGGSGSDSGSGSGSASGSGGGSGSGSGSGKYIYPPPGQGSNRKTYVNSGVAKKLSDAVPSNNDNNRNDDGYQVNPPSDNSRSHYPLPSQAARNTNNNNNNITNKLSNLLSTNYGDHNNSYGYHYQDPPPQDGNDNNRTGYPPTGQAGGTNFAKKLSNVSPNNNGDDDGYGKNHDQVPPPNRNNKNRNVYPQSGQGEGANNDNKLVKKLSNALPDNDYNANDDGNDHRQVPPSNKNDNDLNGYPPPGQGRGDTNNNNNFAKNLINASPNHNDDDGYHYQVSPPDRNVNNRNRFSPVGQRGRNNNRNNYDKAMNYQNNPNRYDEPPKYGNNYPPPPNHRKNNNQRPYPDTGNRDDRNGYPQRDNQGGTTSRGGDYDDNNGSRKRIFKGNKNKKNFRQQALNNKNRMDSRNRSRSRVGFELPSGAVLKFTSDTTKKSEDNEKFKRPKIKRRTNQGGNNIGFRPNNQGNWNSGRGGFTRGYGPGGRARAGDGGYNGDYNFVGPGGIRGGAGGNGGQRYNNDYYNDDIRTNNRVPPERTTRNVQQFHYQQQPQQRQQAYYDEY